MDSPKLISNSYNKYPLAYTYVKSKNICKYTLKQRIERAVSHEKTEFSYTERKTTQNEEQMLVMSNTPNILIYSIQFVLIIDGVRRKLETEVKEWLT